jgi:hypothetical protein
VSEWQTIGFREGSSPPFMLQQVCVLRRLQPQPKDDFLIGRDGAGLAGPILGRISKSGVVNRPCASSMKGFAMTGSLSRFVTMGFLVGLLSLGATSTAWANNPVAGRWVARLPGGAVSYYHFHAGTD